MSKKSSSALDIIERQIKPLLPNKFCIAFSGGIDSTGASACHEKYH